jgi:hypothetical protein
MADDWRKIERGLFESPDGQWRIANPWKLTTELRHRWLVAERRASGSGWCMHHGDHATLHDARAYVEARTGDGDAARGHAAVTETGANAGAPDVTSLASRSRHTPAP